MTRTLRSPRKRRALFNAANGQCQQCGIALDPHDWHADHIEPWCRTRRTNVHELQALCPTCNLRKSAR